MKKTSTRLILALLAGCGPLEEFEPPPLEEFDAFEEPLAPIACPSSEEICSGTGEVYSSLYRVGNNGVTSSDVAQTFTPLVNGVPEVLRLKLRLLRPLSPGASPYLRVRVVEAPDGVVPLSATPLATGEIEVGLLSRDLPKEVALPLTGAEPLVAGETYAFVLSVDAPGAGDAHVGVASHKSAPYEGGTASMRWTEGRGFSTAPGDYDLSFAFGTTGDAPAAFSFANRTGVNRSSVVISDAVKLSGFSGPLTATCNGACTGIARNGVWGSTSVSGFVAGDTIALRLSASSAFSTTVSASVTVGSTSSAAWTVTTEAVPSCSASWNPSAKGPAIVLSNGNMTAVSSESWNAVRATVGRSTGKLYFEMQTTGPYVFIGLGTTAAVLDNCCTGGTASWGYYGNGGQLRGLNTNISATRYFQAHVVGVAVDLTNHRIWWSLDGVWQAGGNPSTGANPTFSNLSGTLYPMASVALSDASATLRTCSSAFTYPIPTGFSPWTAG